ncbi:MAG: polyphosphate kinase 2 family protein [Phycisphaeraceae bacterium]|nr:polyphosphate kinase 2 family protein [Phycisphaeraceae bacterium]
MNISDLLRVRIGKGVELTTAKAQETPGLDGPKDAAQAAALVHLRDHVDAMRRLQERLYAEGKRSMLIVLQGMDASGKDGTTRHVFGPLNPQGVRVTSFKQPTALELSHDFLWRVHRAVPAGGMIAVFNRSHYEDVGVVRVNGLVPKEVWQARYEQINAFESLLTSNGTVILKFFLHLSREEQKIRLQDRIDTPRKHWKFSPGDLEERKKWDLYREAYEEAIVRCSTDAGPWFVIPADRKWYRNFAVASVVRETLEAMNPKIPKPSFDPKSIVIED